MDYGRRFETCNIFLQRKRIFSHLQTQSHYILVRGKIRGHQATITNTNKQIFYNTWRKIRRKLWKPKGKLLLQPEESRCSKRSVAWLCPRTMVLQLSTVNNSGIFKNNTGITKGYFLDEFSKLHQKHLYFMHIRMQQIKCNDVPVFDCVVFSLIGKIVNFRLQTTMFYGNGTQKQRMKFMV